MPVMVIKAENGSQERLEGFMREIRSKTSRLLKMNAERVLVVYRKSGARIYYEPTLVRSTTKGSVP